MRRHVRLARRRPLATRGKRGKRFAGYAPDRAYQDWIRSRPCLVELGCAGRIEAAHVVSRGAGGRDAENLLPLCTRHHQEQHDTGVKSFAAKYGVWMGQTAHRLWEHYQTLTKERA